MNGSISPTKLYIIRTESDQPLVYGVSRIAFESGGFRLGGEITISDPMSYASPPLGPFSLLPFNISITLTSMGSDNRIKFTCD